MVRGVGVRRAGWAEAAEKVREQGEDGLLDEPVAEHLSTFLVAPMTTGGHPHPFRIPCRFKKRDRFVVLDQLRTIDRRRLVKKLGRLMPSTLSKAQGVLREMFAE